MYKSYIKRMLDLLLSLVAVVILSPFFLLLIVLGAVMMAGNPFYTQPRPGKDEKIFRLIKFRTMNNKKDSAGKLLPDKVRINRYGRFLRATSLDELPELLNIVKGEMSIVGPRPLMVRYLPYYSSYERKRHSIRPGLTGYAQIHGRNALTWDERFKFDLEYVDKISFFTDLYVIFMTIKIVVKKEGIELNELGNLDDCRTVFAKSEDE